MKTEAKQHVSRILQMATLTFASVILMACSDDVTGTEPDQTDPPLPEATVGSVTGLVTARGEPASGVSVIISQDGIGIQATATGRNGEYAFQGLPAGDYDIRMTHFGRFDVPSADALWSVSVYEGHNIMDFDLFERSEEWDRVR